ncbi:magnesium transporter MgtE N-terminal domain-containing protein [Tannockella kyphosi]|uniref:magnesium transporter MgtE N-terminal domain-containing protein n=1 Tax=Tannockella kyphosi TaxID=2899121 RepID=UPI0020118FD0|nr:hypothetical protein [Tannockella kyphosi]
MNACGNQNTDSVLQEVSNLIEVLTRKERESCTENQIQELLFTSTVQSLHQVIDSVYLIDIAIALEKFDKGSLLAFYKKIDCIHMAKILEKAEAPLQNAIVTALSVSDILSLFQNMSNDDIADVLGELHVGVQKEILKSIRREDKETLQKLPLYPDDTVGSIMTTEYIALKGTLSIAESLQKIKKSVQKRKLLKQFLL